MADIINRELDKIWKSSSDNFSKRMFEGHMPGHHFYYIFNVDLLVYEYLSGSVKDILGYQNNDISVLFLLDMIHPEDLQWFSAIENKIQSLFDEYGAQWLSRFEIVYDFRFKHPSGQYIRLLRQMIQVQEPSTKHYKRYGIVTNIDYLKKEGKPSLNLISIDGNESFIDMSLDVVDPNDCQFTRREKEIIKLIIKGHSSKEIADQLFISFDTVRNHKKNIFKKADCNSATQLFKKCITMGWTEFYSGLHDL